MGFSDRILGKKNVNGAPHIEAVAPSLALAGGEIRITGSARPAARLRPQWAERRRISEDAAAAQRTAAAKSSVRKR